jgi:hypothetical protein
MTVAPTVKIAKGQLIVQRGFNTETGEPLVLLTSSSTPHIHLGAGHKVPIPMADKDMRFTAAELSEDGKKAVNLLLAEVEGKVLAAAVKQVKQFSDDTGIKVDC